MANDGGRRDAVKWTVWAAALVLVVALLSVYLAMRPGPEQTQQEEIRRQQEDVVEGPLEDDALGGESTEQGTAGGGAVEESDGNDGSGEPGFNRSTEPWSEEGQEVEIGGAQEDSN